MKTVVSLMWALFFLSHCVGCSTLVPDVAQRSTNWSDRSVQLLQRNQNESKVADASTGNGKPLPPVISLQQDCMARDYESILRPAQPLKLVEPYKSGSQEEVDYRRMRDRVFASASQKAIQKLNEQYSKSIAGSLAEPIGSEPYTCPTVAVSESNKVISTSSVSNLSLAESENEQRKSEVVLFTPNLKRSPFLLLTISALVLSGATWPLARRQNRFPRRIVHLPFAQPKDPATPLPQTTDRKTRGIVISQIGACQSLTTVPDPFPCSAPIDWEIESDFEQVSVVPNAYKAGLPLYQKRIANRPRHLLMRCDAPVDRQFQEGMPIGSPLFRNLPTAAGYGIQSCEPLVGFVVLIHEQNDSECVAQLFTVETVVESDDGSHFAKLGRPVRLAEWQSI